MASMERRSRQRDAILTISWMLIHNDMMLSRYLSHNHLLSLLCCHDHFLWCARCFGVEMDKVVNVLHEMNYFCYNTYRYSRLSVSVVAEWWWFLSAHRPVAVMFASIKSDWLVAVVVVQPNTSDLVDLLLACIVFAAKKKWNYRCFINRSYVEYASFHTYDWLNYLLSDAADLLLNLYRTAAYLIAITAML